MNATSRVQTLGTRTISVGNLETIHEDLSSDTYYDFLSQTKKEMSIGDNSQRLDLRLSPSQRSRDMHAPRMSDLGKKPSKPFIEKPLGLKYNMALTYKTTNEHNAHIYIHPFARYVVKIVDNNTPLNTSPWVNYQVNSYMVRLGDKYLVTLDPWNVDNMGCWVEPSNTNNKSTNQHIHKKKELQIYQVRINYFLN